MSLEKKIELKETIDRSGFTRKAFITHNLYGSSMHRTLQTHRALGRVKAFQQDFSRTPCLSIKAMLKQ